MWIFSTSGFFSIVQKGNRPGTPFCIRARVREDLENLQAKLDALGPIEEELGTDYPYRIYANGSEVSTLMFMLTEDITYSNFKSEVAKTQGYERAHLYSDVWSVMYGAEKKLSK